MRDRFKELFGTDPVLENFTPGRVNLIGEHTDYNGGMVLPTALPLGINLAISLRNDQNIHIASDGFEDVAQRNIGEGASNHWSDYILGAATIAQEAGLMSGGANILARSNLPFGAGISSSAAVTVGILKLARTLSNSSLSDTEIAKLARRVENEFIEMPCGIMDQMAVAIARPGQALALDTISLEFNLIALPEDHHIAVIHSGVYRKLSEGRYKIRKEECDVVKSVLGTNDICLMDDEDFNKLANLEPRIQKRAKHCMTEHQRTVAAAKQLKAGNFSELGQLMIKSHNSMRDDFDITVPAIDKLVEDAVRLGALGARMTGGGFGGCIVALITNDKLVEWRDALLERHPNAFWVV